MFSHFKDESEVLYTALIDGMETTDTAILCSQFPSVYSRLQKFNKDTLKSTLQEQYQVICIKNQLCQDTKVLYRS